MRTNLTEKQVLEIVRERFEDSEAVVDFVDHFVDKDGCSLFVVQHDIEVALPSDEVALEAAAQAKKMTNERSAFETWCTSEFPVSCRNGCLQRLKCSYKNSDIDLAWLAWQASSAGRVSNRGGI